MASSENSFAYVGSELEVFAEARNWKEYFRKKLKTFITGDVLEVGAGIGAVTATLFSGTEKSWVCLEPDERQLGQLQTRTKKLSSDFPFQYCCGTLASLKEGQLFDTILYIDVLEHIEADQAEVLAAFKKLKPNGRLVILSPAYQFLFTPFDQAIGHYRRYTLKQLKKLTPPGAEISKAFYLDSVGFLASLANKLFLKASMPKLSQIRFWDRMMVPCSKLLDPLHCYSMGRSVIIVWKNGTPT